MRVSGRESLQFQFKGIRYAGLSTAYSLGLVTMNTIVAEVREALAIAVQPGLTVSTPDCLVVM